MIYTVTFNPSLDYIVTVKHFETGKVNRTTEEHILPGGKGINVSMVLNNLGMDTRLLGFTAGFSGTEIERLLTERGCVADFIKAEDGNSRINVKMRSDEESEINGVGPVITELMLDNLMQKLDGMKDGDVLVLAGSIPASISDNIYFKIMERIANKDVLVVVDATKDLLLNVLQLHPFMVKPNNHELSEMLGVEIRNKNDVIKNAMKLKELGARNVLISMAGDGAVLVTENGKIFESEALKGTVKNSVGAGDSMVAGFIYGYLSTKDYREAFEYGVCSGSASAFSEELATKEEVEALRVIQKGMTREIE